MLSRQEKKDLRAFMHSGSEKDLENVTNHLVPKNKIVENMNTQITVEQLQGMNSTELRKAATQLGIKNSKTYSKAILLQMSLNVLSGVSTPEETQFAADNQPTIEEKYPANVEGSKEFNEINSNDIPEAGTEDDVVGDKVDIITTEHGNLPAIVTEFDIEEAGMQLPEIAAIFHSATIATKSEKFRMLHKEGKGLRVSDIAKLFDAHYSYVFGVITRQRNADKNAD